jgi:flagellin-like protein
MKGISPVLAAILLIAFLVTKPFEKITFWGNACPEYKIKKEYKWEEVNISGQGEAVIANDGDVIFSPTIIIGA